LRFEILLTAIYQHEENISVHTLPQIKRNKMIAGGRKTSHLEGKKSRKKLNVKCIHCHTFQARSGYDRYVAKILDLTEKY
jgi:hypothetical protein